MDNEWINHIEKLWEYRQLGEYNTALREGEQLLEKSPVELKTLLSITIADVLLLQGDCTRAQEFMGKARENFSETSLYIDQASLAEKETLPYFYQGNFEECQQQLVNAEQNSYPVQARLAQCRYWTGNFDEALLIYQKAEEMCKANENLLEEARWCTLGQAMCHYRKGNAVEAHNLLETICQNQEEWNDKSPEVLILAGANLARVLAMQGRILEARAMFRENLSPSHYENPYYKAACLLSRAIVRMEAGSDEGALKDLASLDQLAIRDLEKIEGCLLAFELEMRYGKIGRAMEIYDKIQKFPQMFFYKNAEEKTANPENYVDPYYLSHIDYAAEQTKPTKQAPIPEPAIEEKTVPTPEPIPTPQPEPQPKIVEAPKKKIVEEKFIDIPEDAENWSEMPLAAIMLGLENYQYQCKEQSK